MLKVRLEMIFNMLQKREITKAIVVFGHMGCENALKLGILAPLWQSVITLSSHLDTLFYWADKCEVL